MTIALRSDTEKLRAHNRAALLANRPFVHPDYPPPFDDYPKCCYVGYEDIFGHLPDSKYGRCKASTDRDPFSYENLELAQRAIDRYRAVVPYPAWSNRIPEYPAPDWCNRMARQVMGANFASAEKVAGHLVEWMFEEVVPLFELRAFTLACLRRGDDPRTVLRKIYRRHRQKPIEDITRYLVRVAKQLGEVVPKGPRGEAPITRIYRPDLSDAVPGWEPGLPDWDAEFARETEAFHQGELDWSPALDETGLSIPDLAPDAWVEKVRANIDPVRAKAKANKLSRFGR